MDRVSQVGRKMRSLTDHAQTAAHRGAEIARGRRAVSDYGNFLASVFGPGSWFVTITLRDRSPALELHPRMPGRPRRFRPYRRFRRLKGKVSRKGLAWCRPDLRIRSWEPDARHRVEPGPPVRDLALREVEHWLFELGWEAAARKRQELFAWLAEGLNASDRRMLARHLVSACPCGRLRKGSFRECPFRKVPRCLVCAILARPDLAQSFEQLFTVSSGAIFWVIAEEFGSAGGRWHVHLLIRGVEYLRRRKWWRRAFVRFGRTRIEPILSWGKYAA